MPAPVSTERLFALPAFEGLRLIRTYWQAQPELGLPEVIALVQRVDPDGGALDLEAASYLHTLVDGRCPLENPEFYRVCIRAVVVNHQPLWAKSMRQGRKRFVSGLDQNDQDVFAAAELMVDPAPIELANWWDDVAGYARLAADAEKMARARKAEKLSFDQEREKVAALGLDEEVQWPGLDDNYAGYDILSYEIVGNETRSIMIEVKSTIASPLRFILSRPEWDQAAKIGERYFFHIWDMTKAPPERHVRTVEEIAIHIPQDQEHGKWGSVEIPINAT